MKQLVGAANQMHAAGVFHRDLKLENILVEFHEGQSVPRLRVIDFGCGCLVRSGYQSYSGTSEPPHMSSSSSAELLRELETFSCPHRNVLLQAAGVLHQGEI